MILVLKPRGWTGSAFQILDANGAIVGDLDLSSWRDQATLTLGEAAYAVRKDPVDKAFVVLGADGLPRAQAVKPSVWKSEFRLDWGEGQGRLYRPSAWGMGAFVVDGDDGERLVRVERKGVWSQRIVVGSVDAWPLERTAFVAALVAFVLRAEAAAAGAA